MTEERREDPNDKTAGDLTAEQREVVESWGQGIAVLAGAGSGKTFTLVRKVRELLIRNPEARFAAVSFTEKSASDLRAKLTRLTLELQGRPLQSHVVTTIHGFCSAIIREYPREAGFDGDEIMLSETEGASLWAQALDGLFFEELPPDVDEAFARLSERETRNELYALLARVRDLQANGVLVRMENAPELRLLAEYALERYDRLKRRRGALDFNDLELGAARALEHDPVAADYRKRFDLVMVDEFQDTNPVQARILTRLARPGLANLCVVGDPKQSIYRFRDADVSVFEEFCSHMPVQVALTRNFRSVPGILEFSNAVCAPAFATSGMDYRALTPGLVDDPDTAPVESAEVRSPEELARLIQNEVARGVPLADMALLLRTIRGKNEKWLKALTAAGVPLAIESGGLLWNDPRARELACLLRWWANPANEIMGVAFLRAPWIGIPETEIEEWRRTDPGMLHAFLRSNHPAARLLRPLKLHPGRVRPGEVLLSLLELPLVEEDLGVAVLALWHRAEELTEEGLDFPRVAERIFAACDEDRRERAVPPPRNAGQLRVMTVHGSKGLEFPHVILLDFPEKTKRASRTPLFFWDRERGAYLAGKDENGDRLKKDAVESEWKKLEVEKELAESKRVLYVALTRAKKRLLLVLPTTDDEKKREEIAKHREKIADFTTVDFWRGWIEPALKDRPRRSAPVRAPEIGPAPSEPRPDPRGGPPAFLPRRPRHSVSEWNLLSRCERAYEWSVIRPIAPTEEEEWREFVAYEAAREERPSKRPKIAQNEIGTRVHRALELEEPGGLVELEKLLGESVFRAGPVISWMNESPWMRGTDGRVAWKELAFEIPIPRSGDAQAAAPASAGNTATLIGALDRLVRDPDGSFTILDFKVTARKKSEAELLETYRTQLNLYAWALEGLVPESRGRIRALLIHIAGGQVTEIEVPLEANRLAEFRARAETILRGKPGEPHPHSLCEVCDHLERCAEGKRFVASAK
ncbi:MAG: UvrD-helicase domain-containing protein [Bdellovibrionales bacterium]|nr:UvrD-helicase domain-containing protein [Bdellovibrionales bacterium]